MLDAGAVRMKTAPNNYELVSTYISQCDLCQEKKFTITALTKQICTDCLRDNFHFIIRQGSDSTEILFASVEFLKILSDFDIMTLMLSGDKYERKLAQQVYYCGIEEYRRHPTYGIYMD